VVSVFDRHGFGAIVGFIPDKYTVSSDRCTAGGGVAGPAGPANRD